MWKHHACAFLFKTARAREWRSVKPKEKASGVMQRACVFRVDGLR